MLWVADSGIRSGKELSAEADPGVEVLGGTICVLGVGMTPRERTARAAKW